MSIFAWIILGLISGFIASRIVNHSGQGMLLDVVLGVVGAVVGGFLFLGETITPVMLAGMVLIIGGIAILNRRDPVAVEIEV